MVETNGAPKPSGWTLMFFFAGDNNLAPVMVSELKALKDAGFQQDTTVLVHFDPSEVGAPTRVFNINHSRKAKVDFSVIGDGRDPFVRNLEEDRVDLKKLKVSAGRMTKAFKKGLERSDRTDVKTALTNFLGFCRENHRAGHYLLYLVGHGMIVGNDAFLPDDHVIEPSAPPTSDGGSDGETAPSERSVTALSLKQLEEILRPFADSVRDEGGEFELLSLHSCSMSSVEVAYQLKGTANYMIATQGISFVNGWPYRQLLKKTFSTVDRSRDSGEQVDVPELLSKLYFLSLHNATDFLSAGFSADLCLCELRTEAVESLKGPVQHLSAALKQALDDDRGKELILLAHWRSQSFWQERYTDLYDFCKCLGESCATDLGSNEEGDEAGPQKALKAACDEVREAIASLVVHSDNFGSRYQYAHGLSIYFPWSRPVEDADTGIMKRYETEYTFTTEMGEESWFSFLDAYFDKTRRKSRHEEETGSPRAQTSEFVTAQSTFFEAVASAVALPGPEPGSKPSPEAGIGCTCPSIKNYSDNQQVEVPEANKKVSVKRFEITEGALEAFKP